MPTIVTPPFSLPDHLSQHATLGVGTLAQSKSNTFAILGDSISARCSQYQVANASTTTQTGFRYDGHITWARALSGGAISFDPRRSISISTRA